MKKLFNFILVCAMATVTFWSCAKGDDYDADRIAEEKRKQDSIENARVLKLIADQADDLKAFANKHMPDAQLDDSTGIWLQIDEAGDNNSYSYSIISGGILAPQITVKYKGTLLDENQTVFDQTVDDKTVELSLANVIYAWQIAFLPQSFKFNGYTYQPGGLTANGLKKGAKFKILTPSPWAYDTSEKKNEAGEVVIPANSPLYFEVEVVNIANVE